MATYTLRSQGKEITFCNIGQSGYVYCDMGDRRNHGTLGRQIAKAGAFNGYTLTASDDDLARVCRNWVRAYYRHTPPEYRWGGQ